MRVLSVGAFGACQLVDGIYPVSVLFRRWIIPSRKVGETLRFLKVFILSSHVHLGRSPSASFSSAFFVFVPCSCSLNLLSPGFPPKKGSQFVPILSETPFTRPKPFSALTRERCTYPLKSGSYPVSGYPLDRCPLVWFSQRGLSFPVKCVFVWLWKMIWR